MSANPSAIVAWCGTSGQQRRTGQRSDRDAEQHRPQALHQRMEARPGRKLPDIGDKGRQNEQRGGFGRRHDEAEKGDRHGRQSEADDAFHETERPERLPPS